MRFRVATLQPDPYCECGIVLQDRNDDLPAKFDVEAFLSALDGKRIAQGITWKRVAELSKVPASTLTRMSQGRKPDVDSLSALCRWSGLKADSFMRPHNSKPEALAEAAALFRADPHLSKEGVTALEAILKTAYEQLRKL